MSVPISVYARERARVYILAVAPDKAEWSTDAVACPLIARGRLNDGQVRHGYLLDPSSVIIVVTEAV